MKCAKYLLFAFNFVIVLAGLVLIIAGALVQTKFKDYLSFFDSRANAAAIFLMVVGVVVFVIGFFGCCGAAKESRCMILTFIVLLCVVLVLEIAAAALAFVLRNKITKVIEDHMKNATVNYNLTGYTGVTLTWDKVQKKFKCCGAASYDDWKTNVKLNSTGSVPDSCCNSPSPAPQCGHGQRKTHDAIYTNGCVKGFVEWASSNILIVGGIAAALTVVEIIGIVIAGCLVSSIRRHYESV